MTEFETWWHIEGSGIVPRNGEDTEEFVNRITEIAWSNGADKALEYEHNTEWGLHGE